MTIIETNTGPDRGKLIRSALLHRLERHAGIARSKHDEILRYAQRSLVVRMGPRGWHVAERDIEAFMRDIEQRPGWRSDEPARETAMERLRRANRN